MQWSIAVTNTYIEYCIWPIIVGVLYVILFWCHLPYVREHKALLWFILLFVCLSVCLSVTFVRWQLVMPTSDFHQQQVAYHFTAWYFFLLTFFVLCLVNVHVYLVDCCSISFCVEVTHGSSVTLVQRRRQVLASTCLSRNWILRAMYWFKDGSC